VLFFNAFELGAESANNELNCVQMSFWVSLVITLWYTTFIKKIFRTNPTKILFQSIINSYKFTGYWYSKMIKELLDVTFPNNRTTTYWEVLQNVLREQHNELKVIK
jgi:hypothetical protein